MARKFFTDLKTSLILVFLATLALMTLFEVSKQILIPNITVWGSHLITILFTSALAIIVSFFTFQSIHEAHLTASNELKTRIATEKELKTAFELLTAKDEELRIRYTGLENSQHALSEAKSGTTMWSRTRLNLSPGSYLTARMFLSMKPIAGISTSSGRTSSGIASIRIHPEDREMVARHFSSLTPQHPVEEIDERIIMPDGSTHWQRWSNRAIFNRNGTVIEYQSVGRDITDAKQVEKALSISNKKLKLLSGITRHDINNQLTMLMGYLQILEMKRSDPAFTEYFQKARNVADRISTMIQFTEEYESIGVNAAIWLNCRTVVDTAAKQIPLGKILVRNDLPIGAEVFADPLIVRVFYNMMDNAVHYGGKITTIRFFVEERDGNPVVICEDDGDGVDS